MRGSRNFCQGGGPGQTVRKQPGHFLVLNIFNSLQRGSNGYITEKTIIFQGSNLFQGGPTLTGGSNFSQGGVHILISIETHIICDFPGSLSHPLDPRMLEIIILCSSNPATLQRYPN